MCCWKRQNFNGYKGRVTKEGYRIKSIVSHETHRDSHTKLFVTFGKEKSYQSNLNVILGLGYILI